MVIDGIARILPCSREQAFDVAANIERYPEFLRGWISATIQTRDANVSYVEQVLGFGPVRVQIRSKAVFHRPERIDVTSSDPPFRNFSLTWQFEAVRPSTGCRVSLAATLDLRSSLLQRVVDRVLPAATADAIAAFEARIGRLYSSRIAIVVPRAPPS